MISKLLLPTDFSEQAHYAFEVACQLAKQYKAQLHLIHLVEIPYSLINIIDGNPNSELPEAFFFMKLAQQNFKKLKSEQFAEGVDLVENVSFSNIHSGILEYVEKHDIDAIVMGSHGSTGFEELFIGSNTEKVVRQSKIPVFVIKKQHIHFKIDTIVFATDLEKDNIEPLKQALLFAKTQNATLKLVYINTPDRFEATDDIMLLFGKFAKDLEYDTLNFEIYNDLKVERGIMNYAKSQHADLIALGTHGRKGLAHFLTGSLSEGLVNHAKRPVLTFKIS